VETAAESARGGEAKDVCDCVRMDRWSGRSRVCCVSVGGDGGFELLHGTTVEMAVVVGIREGSDVVSCEAYGKLLRKLF